MAAGFLAASSCLDACHRDGKVVIGVDDDGPGLDGGAAFELVFGNR